MAFPGTVKVWRPEKGFGFIIAEDGTELYAHVSGITDGRHLKQGDNVTFDIEEGKVKADSFQACNISGGTGGNTSDKGGGKGANHVPTGALTGEVKSFVWGKGYGFIVGPDGSDVFVHMNAIVDGMELQKGDTVTYDIEDSKADQSKKVAANVAGGSGWPKGKGKGDKDGGKGGKSGKADDWGGKGWGDDWGGKGWGDDSGYGAAPWGKGKGKDGPYCMGKGKKMAGILAAMMDSWGEDGWGDDGWGGDGWGGDGKGEWGGYGCKGKAKGGGAKGGQVWE